MLYFLTNKGKELLPDAKSVVHIKIRREKRISYWSKIQMTKNYFLCYSKKLIMNYILGRI